MTTTNDDAFTAQIPEFQEEYLPMLQEEELKQQQQTWAEVIKKEPKYSEKMEDNNQVESTENNQIQNTQNLMMPTTHVRSARHHPYQKPHQRYHQEHMNNTPREILDVLTKLTSVLARLIDEKPTSPSYIREKLWEGQEPMVKGINFHLFIPEIARSRGPRDYYLQRVYPSFVKQIILDKEVPIKNVIKKLRPQGSHIADWVVHLWLSKIFSHMAEVRKTAEEEGFPVPEATRAKIFFKGWEKPVTYDQGVETPHEVAITTNPGKNDLEYKYITVQVFATSPSMITSRRTKDEDEALKIWQWLTCQDQSLKRFKVYIQSDLSAAEMDESTLPLAGVSIGKKIPDLRPGYPPNQPMTDKFDVKEKGQKTLNSGNLRNMLGESRREAYSRR